MPSFSPSFSVISGETIASVIHDNRSKIVELIKETYAEHDLEHTINPDSYFLRFKDKPNSRIIALPAALTGKDRLSGIKWISSYPDNVTDNLPRASAALILNHYETGYPYACLEASLISAARTAASAVLAANVLGDSRRQCKKIAFVGAGIIARNILDFFKVEAWEFEQLSIFDLQSADAERFAAYAIAELGYPGSATASLTDAITEADIVVFATTAAAPYVTDINSFSPNQLILNISLRDISPDIIKSANNVLDDVDHCMKANTSPHLAEQKYQNRDFVTGTLAQVMTGAAQIEPNKLTIFSPFGLGVLDLALGNFIYNIAKENGQDHAIPNFFAETVRWAGQHAQHAK